MEHQMGDDIQSGIVRGTTNGMLHLYYRMKNMNALFKYSAEAVENMQGGAIPKFVESFSEPIIVGLDSRIGYARKAVEANVDFAKRTMNTCLISPVNESFVGLLDADKDGQVSVADVRNSVACAAGVAREKIGDNFMHWKSLRGKLSKKATERLEQGLSGVSEFSATRGKEMIHFDLIDYSKKFLDSSAPILRPRIDPFLEPVLAAWARTHASVEAVQQLAMQQGGARAAFSLGNTASAAKKLKQGLAKAVSTSQQLAFATVQYIDKNVNSLPTPLQSTVRFILESPQMVAAIKEQADFNTSKNTLDNVSNLLSAVGIVVFGLEDQKEVPSRATKTPLLSEIPFFQMDVPH